MDKTLKNGVKYDWNESPQPQMVGFCNLVGTDIAPVSKKIAVKEDSAIHLKKKFPFFCHAYIVKQINAWWQLDIS